MAIDKPIARKGDTLSYNAAIFRKDDEKTLEDLMKRLPGLEVNQEGKVQYQGKEIEKIMVSGQDLMGRGYQMLTRNLDAKSVKKVDVLEHYQDERLLRNVEQCEKVALNLQLEGDAHAWMGVLKGAYGFPHAYEANVNLTYLTSSQQWMVLGNSNRVGYHPLKDVTTLQERGLGALGSSAGDYDGVLSGVHSGAVVSLEAGGAPLSDARSRWNLSHMVGVNGVVKPLESLQLRLNAAFMQEADTFAQRQQSHYQIDALTFDRFSESEQMERLRLGWLVWM